MTTSKSLQNSSSIKQFKQVYDDAPETIAVPKHLQHHRIVVTVSLLDEDQSAMPIRKRTPPAQFAGRVKELGDVINTLSAEDWGLADRSYWIRIFGIGGLIRFRGVCRPVLSI